VEKPQSVQHLFRLHPASSLPLQNGRSGSRWAVLVIWAATRDRRFGLGKMSDHLLASRRVSPLVILNRLNCDGADLIGHMPKKLWLSSLWKTQIGEL